MPSGPSTPGQATTAPPSTTTATVTGRRAAGAATVGAGRPAAALVGAGHLEPVAVGVHGAEDGSVADQPAVPEVPCPPASGGGDPACWLDRVCDACGRLVEHGDTCPACGAALE